MIDHGMIGTLRLFIDVSYAVTLMAFMGIAAGFVTATITSDTQRSLQVAIGIFAFTGALLTIRLWRTTRGTGSPRSIPRHSSPPDHA
jgi:membrane protein implicated in regulation of membrane protease activity